VLYIATLYMSIVVGIALITAKVVRLHAAAAAARVSMFVLHACTHWEIDEAGLPYEIGKGAETLRSSQYARRAKKKERRVR
jgi:hypothetical protein